MSVSNMPLPAPVAPQVAGASGRPGQGQAGSGKRLGDGPGGQSEALLRLSERFSASLDALAGADETDTGEAAERDLQPQGLAAALKALADAADRVPARGLEMARQAVMGDAGAADAQVLPPGGAVRSAAGTVETGRASTEQADTDDGPTGSVDRRTVLPKDAMAVARTGRMTVPDMAEDAQRSSPAPAMGPAVAAKVRASGRAPETVNPSEAFRGLEGQARTAGSATVELPGAAVAKPGSSPMRGAVLVSDEMIPAARGGREAGEVSPTPVVPAGGGERASTASGDLASRKLAGAEVSVVRGLPDAAGLPGGGEVRRLVIRLEPVHLGKVTALLSRTGEGLELRLMPEQAAAREALKMDSAALARILRLAGVSSEAVAVQVIDPERPAGVQASPSQGQTAAGGGAAGGQGEATGNGATAERQPQSAGGGAQRGAATKTDIPDDDATPETGRGAAGGAVYI